jgi:hypothetical protein
MKTAKKPTVKIVRSTYQPSKAELAEDPRLNASFEQIVKAATAHVKIKYIDKPRRKK